MHFEVTLNRNGSVQSITPTDRKKMKDPYSRYIGNEFKKDTILVSIAGRNAMQDQEKFRDEVIIRLFNLSVAQNIRGLNMAVKISGTAEDPQISTLLQIYGNNEQLTQQVFVLLMGILPLDKSWKEKFPVIAMAFMETIKASEEEYVKKNRILHKPVLSTLSRDNIKKFFPFLRKH